MADKEALDEINDSNDSQDENDSQNEQEDTQIGNDTPPAEKVARDKGWVSKEEWEESGKDPEDWVSAKEFTKRGEYFDEIHKLKRENKKLIGMMDQVKGMVKGIKDSAKQDAMKELQEQFEEAAENRDVKAAITIKDKMDELKESDEDSNEAGSKNTLYDKFLEENPWMEDEDLATYAEGLGAKLARKALKDKKHGQALTQDEIAGIYEEVAKTTKEKFPQKFTNPNRQRVSNVTDSNRRVNKDVGGKKKYSIKDIPDDESRRLARNLIKQGVFKTEDEYMKSFIANGGKVANQE